MAVYAHTAHTQQHSTCPSSHIHAFLFSFDVLQNGKEQTLQFDVGDSLLFDFSKGVEERDSDGNVVTERKMKVVKNRVTGVREEKEVDTPVMKSIKFRAGVVSEDGPLCHLIGWPKGKRQFLMERDQWSVGGLKDKCGAKTKDHTGSCCATGLMYDQQDFQVSASKLTEIIRSRGHVCLFLPRCFLTLHII